jgi:hypothetical protein
MKKKKEKAYKMKVKDALTRIKELKDLCLKSLENNEEDFKKALNDFIILEDIIIDGLRVRERLTYILNDITHDIERLRSDLI